MEKRVERVKKKKGVEIIRGKDRKEISSLDDDGDEPVWTGERIEGYKFSTIFSTSMLPP